MLSTIHNPQSTIHNPQSTKPKPWARYFVTRLAAVLLLCLPFHLAQAADTVYAAINNGGLSISSDGGTTFSNKTTANGLGHNGLYGVAVSGSNVYVATYGGLSISNDGGATFSNKTTSDGLGNNRVYGVAVSGNNVYAATPGGLSISNDGGATFSNKTTVNGLGDNYVRSVAGAATPPPVPAPLLNLDQPVIIYSEEINVTE